MGLRTDEKFCFRILGPYFKSIPNKPIVDPKANLFNTAKKLFINLMGINETGEKK